MSRPEQFSRAWPTTGPLDNTSEARGFVGATGRTLPWTVRAVLCAVFLVLGWALWVGRWLLRHPDVGIGS